MAPGIWDIPVPAEGEPVQPDAVLAPLVGFDGLGYRLGYGGGYYDRTLAAMDGPLLAIGVGFELAQLDTIHPQPHDVPMSAIVTERRVLRLTGSVVDAGGEPRE
jgi:5-formyltetrahydrofolate cyclo-ligase